MPLMISTFSLYSLSTIIFFQHGLNEEKLQPGVESVSEECDAKSMPEVSVLNTK